MRPALTERQREILNYIEREVRTTGVPPSIRQIGVALGISSTNGVRAHLQALEKKGYIRRVGKRAIEVLSDVIKFKHGRNVFMSTYNN